MKPEDLKAFLDAEAEAVEADRNAPLKPGTAITWRGQTTRVYSIRLGDSEIRALEAAAGRAGMPASRLARTWIAERLVQEQAGLLADDGVRSDVTDVHAIADALAVFSRRLAAL